MGGEDERERRLERAARARAATCSRPLAHADPVAPSLRVIPVVPFNF
jgi:hypothetical protein